MGIILDAVLEDYHVSSIQISGDDAGRVHDVNLLTSQFARDYLSWQIESDNINLVIAFMNKETIKSRLFDIIMSSKSLQNVVDACEEIIVNPFALSNRSLQLICQSTSCKDYPQYFGWIDRNDGKSVKYGNEANAAGYFRSIYADDAPVYGRVSEIDIDWVAARVRFQDQVVGSILIAGCRNVFTEEYRDILPLVCQGIAFALQQSTKFNQSAANYAPLLRELISSTGEHLGDSASLIQQFKLLQHPLPTTMRILLMRPSQAEKNTDLNYTDALLLSQFPFSLGMIYEESCIRIINGTMEITDIANMLNWYINPED